ncbi:hypothetical protein QA648_35675 (plasmid) [Rhizobium sp. CB3171]|uniref:hypothetical protein n=1 Tax=Rhizobium sp. CB3171 TaxID=3039157 RepID=UPI0024B1C9B9|nr:hypothetical protein [Rhizobium sp. CB3171]WFU07389.1 hypothetical protein QA648_35675 [Rhizobium sp. CB3171]
MTDIPPLPKSRRNLSDLDSLIAESIGSMKTYDEMHGTPDASGIPKDPPMTAAQPQAIDTPATSAALDKPERFQIILSGAVIIAAKLEALRQKTTAGEITERALRAYLDLPSKP